MSMGVKRGNRALKAKLDEVLKRRAPEIAEILRQYHVPVLAVDDQKTPEKSASAGDMPCNCH
jgi:hypothetical protein